MVVMVTVAAVRRRRQFALADGAIAILIQLGEQRIGARLIDTGRVQRALELALADRPVAIGIQPAEQALRAARTAGVLALERNQRRHRAVRERRRRHAESLRPD